MSKIKYVDIEQHDGYDSYSTKPVEEFEGIADERLATFEFIKKILGRVSGKTLTLIDASIADKEQRKAIKDIFKQNIGAEFEFVSGFMYDQDEMNKLANESCEDGEIFEPVDIVDVLIDEKEALKGLKKLKVN